MQSLNQLLLVITQRQEWRTSKFELNFQTVCSELRHKLHGFKMRSDTKAKIDAAIRKQRLKYVAMGCGVAVLLGCALWFTGRDAIVSNKQVGGVISEIDAAAGMSSQVVEQAVMASIKLDDGRKARVLVLKATNPAVGQHVDIAEHIHGTGRSTFSWK
jgi:hypothetical protein